MYSLRTMLMLELSMGVVAEQQECCTLKFPCVPDTDSNNQCGCCCCLLYLSQNICWFGFYFCTQSLRYHTLSCNENVKSVGSIHAGYCLPCPLQHLGVCMPACGTATTPLGEMLPSPLCDDDAKLLVSLYRHSAEIMAII